MARSIEGGHLLSNLFPVPGSQMRVADDAPPPSIWVSLHIGPLEVAPVGTGPTSSEWTTIGSTTEHPLILDEITVYDASWCADPYSLSLVDATPTGIGDPLAGVLRAIDECLGEG